MCHSCCVGLVNIPVKRAKVIILAQAQNQWQEPAYCLILFLGHRSQRLQWPIVITRCPASVRPSVVRRPLDYLHFRLLLQNRLMDFDETWFGWSTQGPLQVLLFFGQIRPGADPGRGKNRSWGPLLQETSSSDQKATATNRVHSSDLETCGKKCCYFLVPFRSQIFDAFLTSFWT